MNIFLAIVPPDEIKKSISDQLKKIKDDYQDAHWINPVNYHLTLHHFEIVADQKKLFQKISDLLYDQEKLYLFSSGLGFFMRHKINIYMSFLRNKELELLEKKFSKEGLSYAPHLSVGNYRIPSKQQYLLLKKKIENYQLDVEFPVTKLILYESILINSEVSYKKLKEFPLL